MDKKTFYITKAKLAELEKELESLIVLERQKTVGEEAPKVLESEDLSSEFVSFQEDMGAIRGRMDELKNILENYELIKEPKKEDQGVVGIGASVTIDVGGKSDDFTIVGTLEANPDVGRISNESPVGKALIGKMVGQDVEIPLPTKKTYKIKSIKYEIS